jgi:uncharacterized protein YaaW (UPF0174 family)
VALVALQGLALVVLGVLELAHLASSRVALAVTTAVFFAVVGAGLLLCARGLATSGSWARGPVVAVQLIGVLTAFSFWGGDTRVVSVVLGLVSAATLVCVLHPASTQALSDDEG